jgi:hypothetical protein
MRLSRLTLLTALAVALAAYAFDCGAAITPEQAMKCCDSMPCSSYGHQGQDCCKTMPSENAGFVRPTPAAGASFVPIVSALLQASIEFHHADCPDRVIAAHDHAPPILSSSASVPLRI